MRIKLDENLPAKLAPLLRGLEHDVDTVPEERLQGRRDPVIWQAAQTANGSLITQDMASLFRGGHGTQNPCRATVVISPSGRGLR